MKFYQALPMLFIALSSCGDDSRSTDPGTLGQIAFGVTEAPADSRSAAVDCTPDEMTLMPDAGCGDITPIKTYITVDDMSAPERAGRGTPITGTGNLGDFSIYSFYYRSADASPATFFANESTKKEGGIWTTVTKYYWPTVQGSTLTFRAMTGIDAEGVTVAPSALTPGELEIDYKVPPQAVAQSDLMLAATGRLNTPGQPVPLEFRHLCAAVRFVTGNEMQPGTIKSIILSGIKNEGQYTTTWNNLRGNAGFTIDVNKATTAGTAANEAIAPDNYTLMMIPQQLGDDAMLTVVFEDDLTGRERTMSASLKGQTWRQGKTTVYHIGITPDYELEFISQPEVQDAHYVIYPIKIKSANLPAGGWVLTSNDAVNVTFVEKDKFASKDIQALVAAGYWLDGYNGESTLTSTTSGEIDVYVFLKENVTDADRNITLSLKPAAQGDYKAKEFSFKQYCPGWNNGIGVERLQGNDYPWGFSWDPNMKITYNLGRGLGPVLASLYIRFFVSYSYVTVEGGGILRDFKVTIDFSKVGALTTATDLSDGRKNTWELYSFNGLNDASSLMAQIESWGGVPDKTLPTNPSEFAARACAMKNKYRVETETNLGNTVYRPVLDQANMVWYLPARNEAPEMKDNLSGNYWTSTAITSPGTTAYKYTAGGSTSSEDRNNALHVRAIRQRP